MQRIDVPPVWMLGVLLISALSDHLWPVGGFDNVVTRGFGLVIALVGLGIFVAAVLWFRRKKTTIHPHGRPTSLIVEGPYRVSRNPIYLAMALILLGQALWLGSALPLLLVLAFIMLITKRFIQPEEENLRQAFGPEAEAYLGKTRRWL